MDGSGAATLVHLILAPGVTGMTRTHLALAVATTILTLSLTAPRAGAQAPPFFGGGGGIFDPEISVVESGIVADVQATVSADRKYVTLTSRFQQADLLALREFAFQVGGGGQVGGAQGAGVGAAGAGAAGGAAVAAGNGAGGADRDGAAQGNGMTGSARGANTRDHAVSNKPYPTPG